MGSRRRPQLVSGVVALLILGSFFGDIGDARSAQSEATAVLQTGDYPNLDWRFETRSQITDAPMVVGDTVLVLSEDGYLYALDGTTGAERWRVETGHGAFTRAHVTVDDGSAFLSDARGRLRAIDVATGETRWRRRASPPPEAADGGLTYAPIFPAATVVDGVVYVDDIVGGNGVVYALDAETGEELWNVETGPMESYQLSVVDGVVFVADINGDLWFIDADSGDVLSRYQTGEPLMAAPVVGNSLAFVALSNGRIEAIQPESGERQWSTELPEGVEGGLAAQISGIAGGVVFVLAGGNLIALDANDGQRIWDVETFDVPTLGDGIVYATDTDGRLTAYDGTTGELIWRGPKTQGERTVAGDALYAAVGSSLFAFDAETGAERWRVRTGGMVRNAVAVIEDRIFVGSTDHFFYAFSRQTYPALPEGFEGSEIGATTEPLATVRLEPLPEAPAFAGIWRVTVPSTMSGTIPAWNGPAAGYLESGGLDFPDGALFVAVPDGFNPVDSAVQGDTIRLPLRTSLAVENPQDDPAELLVFAVVPEGGLPETGEQGGVTVELVGGGLVDTLPGDGAYVDLGRLQLDPGSAIVPTLATWPELVVVESGSLDVALKKTRPGAPGQSPSGAIAGTALPAGEDAVLPAGRLRFVLAGNEPASVLVLAISGNIRTGQGGGCGGRCLQTGG